MKKIAIITLSCALVFGTFSFMSSNNNTPEVVLSSSFKLINDTGNSVKLKHKGGSMTLNKGGSTSLSCTRTGNDIYIDGKKLHTVSSSDCGKTIKLSTWI
jgi:hypothetical protein